MPRPAASHHISPPCATWKGQSFNLLRPCAYRLGVVRADRTAERRFSKREAAEEGGRLLKKGRNGGEEGWGPLESTFWRPVTVHGGHRDSPVYCTAVRLSVCLAAEGLGTADDRLRMLGMVANGHGKPSEVRFIEPPVDGGHRDSLQYAFQNKTGCYTGPCPAERGAGRDLHARVYSTRVLKDIHGSPSTKVHLLAIPTGTQGACEIHFNLLGFRYIHKTTSLIIQSHTQIGKVFFLHTTIYPAINKSPEKSVTGWRITLNLT